MNEKQGTEEEKSGDSKENIDEGSKYETTPIIERAREERERMETATKELREENTRRELIMAKQALGGESEAGQVADKPKEETDKEYSDRVDQDIRDGKYNG